MRLETQNRKETVQMIPDAPESPSGDPDPAAAAPRLVVENTRARGGASAPTHLVTLAETARDYAEASSSANTRKAYASDWRHYSAWTRRHAFPALPPDPQVLGLYVAACASGAIAGKPCSVRTIERRLSALAWNFAQRGEKFDRADRHVATVLAGIRRTQGRPPEQKEAVLPGDLLAMMATLDLGDLRGLRDRAILLIGFAGGLRRAADARRNRLDRDSREGDPRHATRQDRLARGRDRARLQRPHLPRRRARDLVEVRQNRERAAVPPRVRRRQDGRRRPDGRQARRPAGQANRDGGGRARRSRRGRTAEQVLRTLAARRLGLVRRGR